MGFHRLPQCGALELSETDRLLRGLNLILKKSDEMGTWLSALFAISNAELGLRLVGLLTGNANAITLRAREIAIEAHAARRDRTIEPRSHCDKTFADE